MCCILPSLCRLDPSYDVRRTFGVHRMDQQCYWRVGHGLGFEITLVQGYALVTSARQRRHTVRSVAVANSFHSSVHGTSAYAGDLRVYSCSYVVVVHVVAELLTLTITASVDDIRVYTIRPDDKSCAQPTLLVGHSIWVRLL